MMTSIVEFGCTCWQRYIRVVNCLATATLKQKPLRQPSEKLTRSEMWNGPNPLQFPLQR
jgi:hypothetical protein